MPRPVHLAGQRLRRRPDKCDAGRRPSGRRIPRPAASGRTRSLCRSSSSHRNRFAGFRREPCWGGDKNSRFAFFWCFYVGVVSLPSACASCCRNAGRPRVTVAYLPFLCRHSARPVWAEYPRRVHTPPQPLTAHTAAHTPKHGGFSGSMVTMFSAAGSSTPSTLFRQISRSPLLLRKDTVMPFLLRVSTLLRIRWEKLLGVSPSVPAGSIFSNSTLAGALISGCRRSSSERRKRIRSLGCSVCSQSSDSSFQI